MAALRVVSFFGIVLSCYALYIEHQKVLNPEYEALCDIGSSVSCSKVFTSEWGRMLSHFGLVPGGSVLDVPNAALGVVFYVLVFLYPSFRHLSGMPSLLFLASLASCSASAYLGYILYAVLLDFCMVCVSTYVINAIVFFLATRELVLAPPTKQKQKRH